jgi:FkbM family methyltransferase
MARRIPLSRRNRRLLKRIRLRLAEMVGSDRYTWSALGDLDRLLVTRFQGRTGGRFLEIGANDGLQQSNTLALERLYGWHGILVEAHPELAAECVRNRPRAKVVCAAASDCRRVITVDDGDLIGTVGAHGSVNVVAVPLSSLIDEIDGDDGPPFDLMSIDVEGHELEVLSGLDLERHGPGVLLIETDDLDSVIEVLPSMYRLTDQWSFHDFVFERVQVESDPE